MNARDPHVGQQRRLAAKRLGGDEGFASHRQIAGSRCNDRDPAHTRLRLAGRQPEGAGYPVLQAQRKALGEIGGLLGVDSGRQAILAAFGKLADDRFHPLAGFAFAENHLGKTAAAPTLEVDVGEAKIGFGGRILKLAEGRINR